MSLSHFLLQVLRNFDSFISANCTKELLNSGIDMWKNSQVKSVCKTDKGLEVTVVTRDPEKKNDEEKVRTIQEVDCLLWAIGRKPNTSGLNIGELVTVCFVFYSFSWSNLVQRLDNSLKTVNGKFGDTLNCSRS